MVSPRARRRHTACGVIADAFSGDDRKNARRLRRDRCGTDSGAEHLNLDEVRSAYEGEDVTPIGDVHATDAAELLAHRMARPN